MAQTPSGTEPAPTTRTIIFGGNLSNYSGPNYGQGYQQPNAIPVQRGPRENVFRGAVFASAVIPLGILLWLVIWNLGFYAAFVGWAVAAGAIGLYRLGAGFATRKGAWVVVAVTFVTMVMAFLGGMWIDLVKYLGQRPIDAFFDPQMWDIYFRVLTGSPEIWREYTSDIILAIVLSMLGCFFVLRKLFKTSVPS